MNSPTWFQITARVPGMPNPFVDWFNAATEADARAIWAEDAHRYGVPDSAELSVREATEKEAALFDEMNPQH